MEVSIFNDVLVKEILLANYSWPFIHIERYSHVKIKHIVIIV